MTVFDYRPPPPGRYGGLTPYNWPQDNLRIPNGYGQLPRVEALNSNLTRREWYCYTAVIPNLSASSLGAIVVPTDPDGDFWLDNIFLIGLSDTPGHTPNTTPFGRLQVKDIAQGYDMFPASGPTDGIPFAALDNQALATANFIAHSEAGERTSIVQPYCFVRAGGIKVSAFIESFLAPDFPFDLYVNLSGWKEYASAAS